MELYSSSIVLVSHVSSLTLSPLHFPAAYPLEDMKGSTGGSDQQTEAKGACRAGTLRVLSPNNHAACLVWLHDLSP